MRSQLRDENSSQLLIYRNMKVRFFIVWLHQKEGNTMQTLLSPEQHILVTSLSSLGEENSN